jgi:nitroreductase
MKNPAPTDHDVHELIRERWSPRAFINRAVELEKLLSILEAARWAASCFNEQPWFFLVAERENAAEFDRMLDCLVPANQVWAKEAPVLIISVANLRFRRNEKPNRHAQHDLGLATSQLILQATALGLAVHPMAGFDGDKARQAYEIPDHHDPMAALALGYPGEADSLPEGLRENEKSPRRRRPIAEFVYQGSWGRPLKSATP